MILRGRIGLPRFAVIPRRMPSLEIYHCSASDLISRVDKDSVDLILTDPPYPKEFLSCYNDLAALAVHALRPGGNLLAMSGHVWLPEVFRRMDVAGLEYQWMIALTGLNRGASCLGRRIWRVDWKPILWYSKPPRDTGLSIRDSVQADPRDKRYHTWVQDEGNSRLLLERFKLRSGDTVCDPFVGGGTNAVVANVKGMNFVGCDVDLEAIKTTRQRLSCVQTEIEINHEQD